jgi:hypothetical protein
LREIFEKEFVHKPFTSLDDLKISLDLLEKAGIIRVDNDIVSVEDFKMANMVVGIVEVSYFWVFKLKI